MPPSSAVEHCLQAIYQAEMAHGEDSALVPMGRLASAPYVVPGTSTTMAKALEARRLVELRDRWLNPPEWVEWVDEPVPGYPKRPIPRDEEAEEAHADEPLQRGRSGSPTLTKPLTRLWLPRTVGRPTDLVRLRNNVARWMVRKTEFGFGETATDASRLTVNFTLDSHIGGDLKASGANCLRLAEVFRKFILPGLDRTTP